MSTLSEHTNTIDMKYNRNKAKQRGRFRISDESPHEYIARIYKYKIDTYTFRNAGYKIPNKFN